MLKVEHITKVYDEVAVVKDVSFELKKGEIVGFLGPNGAGKTTMMKMITGLLKPTQGNIFLQGKPIHTLSTQLQTLIGYLPESNPLYGDMYVVEFLEFIGKLYAIKDLKKRIEKYIDLIELRKESHKKIKTLSKGYKQRVGIATAMLHEPELLILDEPTSGLDPNQLVEIREVIREIGKSKTILFSSHILPEVQALAARVIVINNGQIVLDNPVKTLSDKLEFQPQLILKLSENVPLKAFDSLKPFFTQIENKNQEMIFTTSQPTELKKAIFKMSLDNNWNILYLQESSQNLEYIFKQLTQK